MLGLLAIGAGELSLSTAISFWRFCELKIGITEIFEMSISTVGFSDSKLHAPNLAIMSSLL